MRDEAARQATLSLIIGRLEDFAKRVQNRMTDVDWAMRRDLIRVLVKRVEIHPADVNVVFRIDPTAPMPEPGARTIRPTRQPSIPRKNTRTTAF